MADVVADALFHVIIRVRFRRRGEGQERASPSTSDRLRTIYENVTLSSLIATADRGYGREDFSDYLR